MIELLVVIAIIGILASIVLVSMGSARAKARDTVRKSDMRQIVSAMQLCYDDSGCGAGASAYYTTSNWPTQIGDYMAKVPRDPRDSSPYVYNWEDNTSDSQAFCAWAILEGPSATTYFAASQNGTLECTTQPTLSACCS